ncbi:MAG: GNAT family N-acetyltransferase [Candidatus Gastranaerophilaceae bacterium]
MDEKINIRLAELKDMKNVFDLSNDKIVRQNSIHPEQIEWDNHVKWFNNKIKDINTYFYVIEYQNNFAGYCRLDRENYDWIITIHITFNYRGRGIGRYVIDYICQCHPDKHLIAYVKTGNKNSYNLFSSMKFENAEPEILGNTKCYKFVRNVKNIIAVSNTLYKNTSLFNKNNIEYITNKADLNFHKLKAINPKYVFFPHWSYIIPAEIYENFNCVIFHMTDLPFGRGGSPLQNLIERGIYNTKISAIKCVKELDGGDIYMKRDLDISYGSAQEIYMRAGEIISVMIDNIIEQNPIPQKQVGDIVEFKRRKREQSNIYDLKTIKKIYDYIRMLDADGYPNAYIENNGIKYEFFNAKMGNNEIVAQVSIKEKKDE